MIKEDLEKYFDPEEIDLYKPGKTTKYRPRMNTYNTGLPNKYIELYRIEIEGDLDALDLCMKSLLKKHEYISKKEFYDASLIFIIEQINICVKILKINVIKEEKLYEQYQIDVMDALHGYALAFVKELDDKQQGGDEIHLDYQKRL